MKVFLERWQERLERTTCALERNKRGCARSTGKGKRKVANKNDGSSEEEKDDELEPPFDL